MDPEEGSFLFAFLAHPFPPSHQSPLLQDPAYGDIQPAGLSSKRVPGLPTQSQCCWITGTAAISHSNKPPFYTEREIRSLSSVPLQNSP